MIRLIRLLSTTISLVTWPLAHSDSFRPLIAANGSTLCAVGGSSSSVSIGNILGIPAGVPDKVKCSYRCSELNTNSECSAFNYINNEPNDKQCQFYQYRPSRCVVSSPGCLLYQMNSKITSLTDSDCSFPFTYDGNLYNKCIPIGNSSNVEWYCYSIDSTRITCPSADRASHVNVALDRTAYQVSTYYGNDASYAISEKSVLLPACTDSFLHPWWAVDLGEPSNVIAVNVTNDINVYYPDRLDNFIVGLSNNQPTVGQSLAATNYTLCAQYDGRVPLGATVLMICPLGLSTFRYVIIQQSLTYPEGLCLVHVEVYVDQNTTINVTVPVTMKTVSLKYVNDWLVIMSRVDVNSAFNATWTTYKDGFGSSTSNFWLGLESLHQLTSELFQTTCGQFYRLRFELQFAGSARWYSEEYDWFYVDGESNGYALHVPTSGAGDAGDALNSQTIPTNSVNGMQFYSYDRDNSNQCAAKYGGGWWNNQCSSSNEMGSNFGGFAWNGIRIGLIRTATENRDGMSLLKARMMVRKVTK